MATTAERAKKLFGQVVARGKGQVEDARQRRQRAHLVTELGELTYRRTEGEAELDAEINRVIEAIRALQPEPDSDSPEMTNSLEQGDSVKEQ